MKKKILIQSLITMGVLGLAGIGVVSAHGEFGWLGTFDAEKFTERQQAMFQSQADLLGLDINKIKNYWSEGKSLQEIAQAEGITDEQLQERMKQSREQSLQKMMQSMVDKGIITQDQANKRLEIMKEKSSNGKFGHGHRGYLMRGW